jgi:hypothetical protein
MSAISGIAMISSNCTSILRDHYGFPKRFRTRPGEVLAIGQIKGVDGLVFFLP